MHLEVVNSMDTDQFIMCLRCFINRRGDVKELRCDNGSNFIGSERELKKSPHEWNKGQIERELIQRRVNAYFNPRVHQVCPACGNVWFEVQRQSLSPFWGRKL